MLLVHSLSRGLVVDLNFINNGSIGSTKVVATLAARISTDSTLVIVTEITVSTRTKSAISTEIKIVSTTPSRTISIVTVHITCVSVMCMFIRVCQREQKACVVAKVTVVCIPGVTGISSNQPGVGLAFVQLYNSNGWTFVITATVEG